MDQMATDAVLMKLLLSLRDLMILKGSTHIKTFYLFSGLLESSGGWKLIRLGLKSVQNLILRYEAESRPLQVLFLTPWISRHLLLWRRSIFSKISIASSSIGMMKFLRSTVRAGKIGWQICQNWRLSVLIVVWRQQTSAKLHSISFFIFPMPQKLLIVLCLFCDQ